MKTIVAIVGAILASTLSANPGAFLSPVVIWSTVAIWMTVAFVLASIVAVLTRPALRGAKPARATGTGSALRRVCTVCA
jgi:hypothetical protein